VSLKPGKCISTSFTSSTVAKYIIYHGFLHCTTRYQKKLALMMMMMMMIRTLRHCRRLQPYGYTNTGNKLYGAAASIVKSPDKVASLSPPRAHTKEPRSSIKMDHPTNALRTTIKNEHKSSISSSRSSKLDGIFSGPSLIFPATMHRSHSVHPPTI
jgi:hypothetical protein